MAETVYLFMSPHLDDIALSCAGYVHRLASTNNSVIIATMATADVTPETPLSWLARRNHTAWRLGDSPFVTRQIEDIHAAQVLGARHVHLGLFDAMYRQNVAGRPLYSSNTVGVSLHPYDLQHYMPIIRETLEQLLTGYSGKELKVFCPISAGGHVDHITLRQAIETVGEDINIIYYEDFPYASQAGAAQRCFGLENKSSQWRSMTIELSEEEIQARIAAAACYVSQLPGLFPSTVDRWREIVRARLPVFSHFVDQPPDLGSSLKRLDSLTRLYISRVGGERYWHRGEG